jgi:hypothetical protein
MSTLDHRSSLQNKIVTLRHNAQVKMQRSITLSEKAQKAKTNASADYYKKKLVANNQALAHLLTEIETAEQALAITEES